MICPICGDNLQPLYICKKALEDEECHEIFMEDPECPNKECYEPIRVGWICPNCGVEYG